MFQPLTGQLQCRNQCSLKSLVSCAVYDLQAKCETERSLYSRYLQLFRLKFGVPVHPTQLTHCGRVTQICVFNTVKLGTSASSP